MTDKQERDDALVLDKIFHRALLNSTKLVGVMVDPDELASLKAIITEQAETIARLREALEPSAATKAAYIGEFSFSIEGCDEDDAPYEVRIDVPWPTIKEVMAAIRTRAALKDSQ